MTNANLFKHLSKVTVYPKEGAALFPRSQTKIVNLQKFFCCIT